MFMEVKFNFKIMFHEMALQFLKFRVLRAAFCDQCNDDICDKSTDLEFAFPYE